MSELLVEKEGGIGTLTLNRPERLNAISLPMLELLSEKLLDHLKKQYWPEVAEREDLEQKARKLTDHEKDGSNINLGPTVSPDGEKIVYISDQDGFSDVYLMSALDGKIIRRVLKGGELPRINQLVDLGNCLSVKYVLPIAAYDLSGAQGDELFVACGELDEDVPRYPIQVVGCYG